MLAAIFLNWGAGITRWYFMPHSWNEVGDLGGLWIYLPMLGIILLRQDRLVDSGWTACSTSGERSDGE
jgi:hypothetical protein